MDKQYYRLMIPRSSPALSPVTDGLTLWIDGRDGIYDTSFQSVAQGLELNTFYVYDRTSETYRLYQISPYGYLYGRYNGSGIIEYVKRNNLIQIGGLEMMGNMPNVRTIEVTIALDKSVMSTATNRCMLLNDGTNYKGWAASSNGVFSPSTSINGGGGAPPYHHGVATTPLVDTAMHHYLVTIGDDLTRYLYKDGLLVSTSESTVPVFNSTTVISTFMTARDVPIGSVMARLASIRMYTDVLTADEIAQNYAYEQSTGRVL